MSYGDVRDLLKGMPASPYDTWEGSYVLDPLLFPVKHRLLRELDEKEPVWSIAEMGGYFGAFLVTALAACPNLDDVIYSDDESYTEGSHDMLRTNVWKMFPDRPILIDGVDRSVDLLGVRSNVDLVHVDGDHSFGGCFFDLVIAYALEPREIWVDDYKAHDDVQRATDAFANHLKLKITYHDTTNGLAVIRL